MKIFSLLNEDEEFYKINSALTTRRPEPKPITTNQSDITTVPQY
jgi:hypothetical protein